MIIHYKSILKYIFISLIVYNLISLFILFTPVKSLKYNFWKFTPYDYNFLLTYPNNYEQMSVLNEFDRDKISSLLSKNNNRNFLNINFWNKRLYIDDYSKDKNNKFEKSFINLFFLTKNNKNKNIDLKKYFISNYNYFSEKNKKIILENYN